MVVTVVVAADASLARLLAQRLHRRLRLHTRPELGLQVLVRLLHPVCLERERLDLRSTVLHS